MQLASRDIDCLYCFMRCFSIAKSVRSIFLISKLALAFNVIIHLSLIIHHNRFLLYPSSLFFPFPFSSAHCSNYFPQCQSLSPWIFVHFCTFAFAQFVMPISYLCVCLCICACLSVSRSIYLSVCVEISVWELLEWI